MNYSLKIYFSLTLLIVFGNNIYTQTPMLIKDFSTGFDGVPSLYIEDGGYLYFKVYTDSGVQIQRSDGTIINTIPLLTNILEDIEELEIIGGKAYFTAYDSGYNLDLYTHNLIPNTLATKIIVNTTGDSNVSNIVHVNGRLYFNGNTTSSGYQICSIDTPTNSLFIHTAPAPYTGAFGLYIEPNKAYSSTGYRGIVPIGNKLFFNCRAQFHNLLTLDISGSPTFPTLVGATSGNGFSPFPYNGKAYMYSNGDLISSDGTSIVTEMVNAGPYFFKIFQGRLYFSAESSDPTTDMGVLYSLDATNMIREFSTIPAFGGTTTFNRFNKDYSLVVLDNQLHAFINPYPLSSPTYGIHSVDLTVPNSPTITLEIDEVPKEMYNLMKINGFYYYWYLPFNTANQQFKKKNISSNVVILNVVGDSYFSHFKYWQNDLYFTGAPALGSIATCETFPSGYSIGHELYKLSEYQLDCQSTRIADASFFLKDNIMAAQTTISVNDPILLNSNTCHILSAPNISVNNTLQVNPPAVLITNAVGCQ